jgi:hypothetical protein
MPAKHKLTLLGYLDRGHSMVVNDSIVESDINANSTTQDASAHLPHSAGVVIP